MAKDHLYQLVNQNQFEIVFDPTTMETATDVVYTEDEIAESFFGGDMPEPNDMDGGWCRATWWWNGREQVVFVDPHAIRAEVVKRLANQPKIKGMYEIDFVSEKTHQWCENNTDFFKQSNVTYRPSKKHFTHFRTPKRQPKVSAMMMNAARTRVVWACQKFLDDMVHFSIEFKYANSKETQKQAVQLAMCMGMTWDYIVDFFVNRHRYGETDLLFDIMDQELPENATTEQLTSKAFRQWWLEIENSFDRQAFLNKEHLNQPAQQDNEDEDDE